MEQAKIHIQQKSGGRYEVELHFQEGRERKPLKELKVTDAALHHTDVSVERKLGAVLRVTAADGKVLYENAQLTYRNESSTTPRQQFSHRNNDRRENSNHRDHKHRSTHHSQHDTSPQEWANAPYHFIPLNNAQKIVRAEPRPAFDTYAHEKPKRHTGWIDIEITTQTPLYIRDTLTKAELTELQRIEDLNKKAEKKKMRYINANFFAPGGRLKIPGSSLRGMIRNLVEITSFGKFGFFDDKRLYFRSFAGVTLSLRREYNKKMITEREPVTIKPLGGYFKRDRNQFTITPAVEKDGVTYYKVKEELLLKKSFYPQKMSRINERGKSVPNDAYEFFTQNVIFKKTPPQPYEHAKSRQKSIWLYYGKVTEIDLAENIENAENFESGTLVCSGWMHGKYMHWVINEEDQKTEALLIDEKLLKSYKDDVNRDEQANLLKQLEKHPEGVPCFYITNEQGEVISFGHTGMFRLAYEKTIGEHIPPALQASDTDPDIAEAIFGNPKTFAGRVFFEDAVIELQDGQTFEERLLSECVPKILSSPKPTTFQHYLVQHGNDSQHLKHYNDQDAIIRGNKLYWHKEAKETGDFWLETDGEQEQLKRKIRQGDDTQHTIFTPVKPKTKFIGRIRFENLSDVELGALLFSLKLPDGCWHKLGMGKPLGLGSISIVPKLYISNRKERYQKLLTEWNNIDRETDIDEYKTAFQTYVLEQLGETTLTDDLWQIKRLQELKTMLDYREGLQRMLNTRYMTIRPENEFIERRVLPLQPSDVKKRE